MLAQLTAVAAMVLGVLMFASRRRVPRTPIQVAEDDRDFHHDHMTHNWDVFGRTPTALSVAMWDWVQSTARSRYNILRGADALCIRTENWHFRFYIGAFQDNAFPVRFYVFANVEVFSKVLWMTKDEVAAMLSALPRIDGNFEGYDFEDDVDFENFDEAFIRVFTSMASAEITRVGIAFSRTKHPVQRLRRNE